MIYKEGSQAWYRFGFLHRDDGPAVTGRHGGTPELWLHGRPYKTEAGWERAKAKPLR